MKTTLILAVITILSLGTLALVRAQDEAKESVEPVKAAASESNEATKPVSGIRTDVAVEQKLIGGKAEVTTIPVASVFAEGDRFFVLAKGAESGLDFRETEVTLGNTDGLNVEVKTGLFPGDEVVTVSAGQLRFPAFDNGEAASCGDGVCEIGVCRHTAEKTCSVCDVVCVEGETCESGATCEAGKTCGTAADGKLSCTDCGTCAAGTNCADCPKCSGATDLTITADEFFNGSMEVIFEPVSFFGAPGFCPPY